MEMREINVQLVNIDEALRKRGFNLCCVASFFQVLECSQVG